MNKLFLLVAILCFTSCISEPVVDASSIEGMKPVYITEEENFVALMEARPFGDLGKIVYAAPYLLINERFKGIHVLDNSEPADPVKLNFIQIPGNTDFTIKSGFLYANHGTDFKVFRLEDDPSALNLESFSFVETCVIPDFFSGTDNADAAGLFPPNYNGFFECVDPSKGVVINWESTTLIDPECQI